MDSQYEKQLKLLAEAEQAGVDMKSPKAVVTFLLQRGEKQSILSFYKPNSVEFDFERFHLLVGDMQRRKNDQTQ